MDKVAGSEGFSRVTVFPTSDCNSRPGSEIVRRLTAVLDEIRPDALAIPSWGDRYALEALAWGVRTRTPNVVMTDSNQYDKSRKLLAEWAKRRIVSLFQAGIVASKDHRTYLEILGMPNERVFPGYDVVDNDHFARGAADAGSDAPRVRSALRLPQHYFLVSARFVEKKNLPRLLEAFAKYRELAGKRAWTSSC